MKKKTLLFVALTVLALGNFTDAFAVLGYFGNGWTSMGSAPKLIDYNFKGWVNEPIITAYPDSCPITVPDNSDYVAHRIKSIRALTSDEEWVDLTLDSTLVSNHCPPVANAGSMKRNTGVSDGFIELKRYYTGGTTPSVYPGNGHITIGPLPYIDEIQYSTSSNGGTKRGFLLERSDDGGITWTIVRREAGNASLSTSGDNDIECSNGMQWQESNMAGFDCILRFSNYGGQMVRIHDLKIWGQGAATPLASGVTTIKNIDFVFLT